MKCSGRAVGTGDSHLRRADAHARVGRQVIGVAFGVGVAAAFPGLIAKYFSMDVSPYWDAWPAVQSPWRAW